MYINDQDIKKWSTIEDGDLNQLLQEARAINNDILMSSTDRYIKKGWLRKGEYTKLYSIKIKCSLYEVRIVNFAIHSNYSINEYVLKEHVMNYLYGFITGSRMTQNKNTTNEQD